MSERKRRINWGTLAPGLAFVLIIGAGLFYFAQQQAAQQHHKREQLAQVKQLGLPESYPLADIPVYPGMKITQQKHDDAKSDKGEPMDLWELHGTSADDKQKVFDFFKDKLLGRDMSQTQYISIPTGYGATYGDEKYSVELEIEKWPKDKITRIVQRVYRLRK